jgi:glycosyltransferase involved in cell wall biosynthesis
MKRLKIAVYAIALNEEKFVERWFNSCSEADYILIADTGSKDRTVEIAKKLGINVAKINVVPFRFDDARNAALSLLPSDIDLCIALDLDEVMSDDWYEEIQKTENQTTRLSYKFVHRWSAEGLPSKTHSASKIHRRAGFRWVNPVHEMLSQYVGQEVRSESNLEIHHHSDDMKSRSSYLPLLEVAHRENPSSYQLHFWLAREYMNHSRNDEALTSFLDYIERFPDAWGPERAFAFLYLARLQKEKALEHLIKASETTPYLRDPWLEIANYYFSAEDWASCLAAARKAEAITFKPEIYLLDQDTWFGPRCFDLIALASHYLNDNLTAIEYGKKALELKPDDNRLQNNLAAYKRSLASELRITEKAKSDDSESIYFSVYSRGSSSESNITGVRHSQEINRGTILNQLASNLKYLDVRRDYIFSQVGIKAIRSGKSKTQVLDFLFIDWLANLLRKFIAYQGSNLIILDSSLSLPRVFESRITKTLNSKDNVYDLISIWPVTKFDTDIVSDPYTISKCEETISEIGFAISLPAAEKLLNSIISNPNASFKEHLTSNSFFCGSISESDPDRPWLFTNIWQSQVASYSSGTPLLEIIGDPHVSTQVETNVASSDIDVFISHWYSTWYSIGPILKSCENYGYKTTVINTTEIAQEGWENNCPISFFTQFERSCKMFDDEKKFMLFITADISSDDLIDVFSSAHKVLSLGQIGTYSPALSWVYAQDSKFNNAFFDDNRPLAIVPVNDLIFIYISREVVKLMVEFFAFFRKHSKTFEPQVGWGLDKLIMFLVYQSGLVSIRDRGKVVIHPTAKAYGEGIAASEMVIIQEIYHDYLESLGINSRPYFAHNYLATFELNEQIKKVREFLF